MMSAMADDKVNTNTEQQMDADSSKSKDMESQRIRQQAEKALEEKLHKLMNSRRGYLGHFTSKKNEIEKMMDDTANVDQVKVIMQQLPDIICKFKEITAQIGELLSPEEGLCDTETWFKPKLSYINEFVNKTKEWLNVHIKETKEMFEAQQYGTFDDLDLDDSASKVESVTGRSSVTSKRSSICATETAKLAALEQRAALLAEKQELELKKAHIAAQLEIETAQITARLEKLSLETTIAEKRAQVQVLSQFEEAGMDGMNEYASKMATSSGQTGNHTTPPPGLPVPQQPRPQPQRPTGSRPKQTAVTASTRSSNEFNEMNVLQVMNKQNEITEMLVKQNQMSQLPIKEVTVFKGDPLTYKSFIRAFEQTIEIKTDDDSDKLYYLLQYTAGEPHELVRSCEHMPQKRAYKEAKRLLEKHFGDELIVASAYMEKALRWPSIRAEDGKAMSAYALFLTGCMNTMEDVDYMEEMDNPTNMRVVVSKLPYKTRERWRNIAFDIKEQRGRRARFTDLVNFIERQAKIATDPLFGNLQDKSVTLKMEKPKDTVKYVKSGVKGSSFATQVTVDKNQSAAPKQFAVPKPLPVIAVSAFEPPCFYCQYNHALDSCRKIQQLEHKDRVDFLRNKGLCFGCLTPGHMIKTCKKRMQCKTCSLKHPQILHIVKDSTIEKRDDVCPLNSVPPQISVSQQTVGFTAAGSTECLLSIIPVKVRAPKSGTCVETYAFIDPGSTGTFCTEQLKKQLDVCGKPSEPHPRGYNYTAMVLCENK